MADDGSTAASTATSFRSSPSNVTTFYTYLLALGIPTVVSLALAIPLLFLLRGRLTRSASLTVRFFGKSGKALRALVWTIPPVIVFFASILPLGLLIAWGIVTAALVQPPLLGITMAIGGPFVVLSLYAIGHWKGSRWRLNHTAAISLIVAAALLFAELIVLVLLIRPWSYSGTSYVFLALNMAFVCKIVYMYAPGRRADFREFEARHEDGDSDPTPVSGHSKAKTLRNALILYAAALLSLGGLAAVVAVFNTQLRLLGLIISLHVLLLDLEVFLAAYAGLVTRPFIVALLLAGCRGALVGWGSSYWFVGSSSVFLGWSLVLGIIIVDKFVPVTNKEELRRNALVGSLAEKEDGGDDAPLVLFGKTVAVPDSKGARTAKGVLRSPFLMLGIMVAVFIGLLIAVALGAGSLAPVYGLAQWIFGLLSLILSLVFPLLLAAFRIFRAAEWKLTVKTGILLGVCVVAILGAGGLLWGMTGEPVPFVFTAFFPLIVVCAAFLYKRWVANDYELLQPASFRKPSFQKAPWYKALFTGGLTKSDYVFIAVCFSFIVLTVVWGLVSSLLMSNYRWVGWTMAACVGIPLLSSGAYLRYFNTFRFDAMLWIMIGLWFSLLLLYSLLFFFLADPVKMQIGVSALVLLFCIVVFVDGWALAAAVRQLREDEMKLKGWRVLVLLIISAVFLLAFFITLTVLMPLVGVSLLIALCLAGYVGWLVYVWRKNGFYLPKWYRISFIAVALLVAGMGVFLGIYGSSVFLGITVPWGIVAACLGIWAIKDNLRVTKDGSMVFSQWLLPAYSYESERDDIRPESRPILLAYGTLGMLLVWGVFAAIVMSPAWLGCGVAALSILFMVLYALAMLHDTARRFGDALPKLSLSTIKDARRSAADHQLNRDQPVTEVIDLGDEEEAVEIDVPKRETVDDLIHARQLVQQGLTLKALWNDDPDRIKERLVKLVQLDAQIDRAYQLQSRFAAHFQLLCLENALYSRKEEDTLMFKFLRETGRSDLTPAVIAKWSSAERKKFKEELRLYQEQKEKEAAEAEIRRREDEEAARKRRQEVHRQKTDVRGDTPEPAKPQDDGPSPIPKPQPPADDIPPGKDELLMQAQAKAKANGHFRDDSFPPEESSLWQGSKPADALDIDGWKRAGDLCEDKPKLFEGTIHPEDIAQGGLGTCYFLSAISVLATHPERVKKVFITKEANEEGIYAVRFFRDGAWTTVVVDDYLPVVREHTAYAHSTNPRELWVAILEKAYAKLHGDYHSIEGGLVSLALVDLTSGASDELSLQDQDARRAIANGSLWRKLKQYHQAGYLLGCGSHAGSDTNTSNTGIVQGHAYAILDIEEVDGHRLLHCRNPWGRGEWNGDWSDKSDKWTARMKAKLHYVDKDDGSFWISFEDFVLNFRTTYVCRLFSNDWHKASKKGAWRGKTAGGCTNFPTAEFNPQYAVTVTRPTQLFITLAQTEARGTGKKLYHMGFKVVDKKGKRVKNLYQGEEVGSSGSFTNSREVSCELGLTPKVYTILPSLFKAGWETDFTLTVYSDQPVGVKLMDPKSVESD